MDERTLTMIVAGIALTVCVIFCVWKPKETPDNYNPQSKDDQFIGS